MSPSKKSQLRDISAQATKEYDALTNIKEGIELCLEELADEGDYIYCIVQIIRTKNQLYKIRKY